MVPVYDNDSADIAARVLAVEHQSFPRAVADFVAGRLKIDGNRVRNIHHQEVLMRFWPKSQ